MNKKNKITILVSSILTITLLHNIVHFEGPLPLNIYQRLYYIPIVMAAYWFGLKGALITSIISTLSYPHHGHYSWPDRPFYTMNQYAEMLMFNLIAVVTGILSDLETRQRRKYEAASMELKDAYQKLQDSLEQIRRADRLSALGELSAGMAHEIRNTLGSIKGGMEIIAEGIDKESKKHEFIGIVMKEISRLDNIIAEFLKYARPKEPEMRKENLNILIESLVKLVSKAAEQKGVYINLNIAKSLPDTLMDGEQIKQALLNIVLNAIQATPSGQTVQIASFSSNGNTSVSVIDSGDGIPSKDIERLFDPFFTTKDEGTGLGLSISYQILKAHGGDIEARNIERKGSEFVITLPCNEKSNKKIMEVK